MSFNTKNMGYVMCCIALSLVLGISTFMCLVSVGVIAEYEKNNPKTNSSASLDDVQTAEKDFLEQYDEADKFYDEDSGATGVIIGNDNNSSGGDADGTAEPLQITAQDIVNIYAELMNGAKARKPAFTKVEYQVLPDGPDDRVVTEGAQAIDSIFGVVKDLGVFIPEDEARKNPYHHAKGDSDMSLFPVFNMPQGSYLTDGKGIREYVYEELPNGNVRVLFVLVSEDNPEPVAEGETVAPSYTGAVFSPMSKAKIDRTLNDRIIAVIATNISYSLKYHDCYVEFEYNPETMELVSLSHVAYVTIKGSGDMLVGRVDVQKQELESYVFIDDFEY